MSTMTINGKLAPLPDDPDALLVDVVRDALDLTGTKLVCGAGVCGACTVHIDYNGRRHRRPRIASGAEGIHGA